MLNCEVATDWKGFGLSADESQKLREPPTVIFNRRKRREQSHMKFADLPAGSRFRYRGEIFVKADGNLARRVKGCEALFPSDEDVEEIPNRQAGARTRGRRAPRTEL